MCPDLSGLFRWTVTVITGSDNRTQEVLHPMGRASSRQLFLLNQPVGLIKSCNSSDMRKSGRADVPVRVEQRSSNLIGPRMRRSCARGNAGQSATPRSPPTGCALRLSHAATSSLCDFGDRTHLESPSRHHNKLQRVVLSQNFLVA